MKLNSNDIKLEIKDKNGVDVCVNDIVFIPKPKYGKLYGNFIIRYVPKYCQFCFVDGNGNVVLKGNKWNTGTPYIINKPNITIIGNINNSPNIKLTTYVDAGGLRKINMFGRE